MGRPPGVVLRFTAALIVILAGQLVVVRPRLNRRSDRVLAGEKPPRSAFHLYYIALETAKVLTLAALGISLLTG